MGHSLAPRHVGRRAEHPPACCLHLFQQCAYVVTAVREAIPRTGLGPWTERFSVLVEFRAPEARNANEVWDLDNLIKPTLAGEGAFGLRPWRGAAQAADDRVDHLEASRRTVRSGEVPGARIEVRRLVQ